MNIIDKRGPEINRDMKLVLNALKRSGFKYKYNLIHEWAELYYYKKWMYINWPIRVGTVFHTSRVWFSIKLFHNEIIEIFKKIPELQNLDIHLDN